MNVVQVLDVNASTVYLLYGTAESNRLYTSGGDHCTWCRLMSSNASDHQNHGHCRLGNLDEQVIYQGSGIL